MILSVNLQTDSLLLMLLVLSKGVDTRLAQL
nr:MAG TPA: hypothetical protein [Caudoviricetes sp.]